MRRRATVSLPDESVSWSFTLSPTRWHRRAEVTGVTKRTSVRGDAVRTAENSATEYPRSLKFRQVPSKPANG